MFKFETNTHVYIRQILNIAINIALVLEGQPILVDKRLNSNSYVYVLSANTLRL